MSEKEERLLYLFEKCKDDIMEGLCIFAEECNKELERNPINETNSAIILSYLYGAYELANKLTKNYFVELKKDEEERRFHLTCEDPPPDGELVYCVGKDPQTKKELSGIYFYHNGYWWTEKQRKEVCWLDGTGINDYVFYKWKKLSKDKND